MRNIIIKILAISLVIFVSMSCNAQFWAYNTFKETKGVEFSYKLVNEKRLDPESPKVISLKIKNTNNYPVKIEFGLEYYWKLKRVGYSDTKEMCFLPKEMAVGRINDLLYRLEGYTGEQMESDDFKWNLYNLKIEKVEKCESLFLNE